jgi:exonuclease SbcD
MRIVHCADIHLGRRRLDGRLPDGDFATALRHIVQRAVEWKAHAFLIAGDLFDTPQIPPPTLRHAAEALAPLKKARIPVLAIEGNHDRYVLDSSRPTWVHYLAGEGLLTLLSTPFTTEGPCLAEYDAQSVSGAWLLLDGVRFVGAGYLGAGTVRKTQALLAGLPPHSGPTVMLLHAGPEYFVGEGGGFDKETLALLRDKVTYLALGHIHKPMAFGDEPGRSWAINPGSVENCRLDEADRAGPRGYAEIEIDPKALPGMERVRATIHDVPRRPVATVELDVSPFGNKTRRGVDAIAAAALEALKEKRLPPETAVRLLLTGELNIGRIALDPDGLGRELGAKAALVAVEVSTERLCFFTGRGNTGQPLFSRSTAEIERAALDEILRERPPEDLDDRLADVAELAIALRGMVDRGVTAEAVIELLEQSPLPAALTEARGKALGL